MVSTRSCMPGCLHGLIELFGVCWTLYIHNRPLTWLPSLGLTQPW